MSGAKGTGQALRVGIVGAGANTRLRHIPGLRAVAGVEIAGVVNRTPESTARAAAELNIPRTYETWQQLVDDPRVDAVVIGTWPDTHCDITCAALAAGKHVLCEARMARSLAEARRMLAGARQRPDLVAQIVPSPCGLTHDPLIRDLLEHDYLGELREVVVIAADDRLWDSSQPLHWRQDRAISGVNVLTLGIIHETLTRWVPGPTRVSAQSQTFEPTRPDLVTGGETPVTIPDSLQIFTQIPARARGIYHVSGVALFGPGLQIHLYGSHGTLRVECVPTERVLAGRRGDRALQELSLPDELRGGWRVEAEFVGAIRGEEPIRFTDFATGVRYMEFTEAVDRSATQGQAVDLPL